MIYTGERLAFFRQRSVLQILRRTVDQTAGSLLLYYWNINNIYLLVRFRSDECISIPLEDILVSVRCYIYISLDDRHRSYLLTGLKHLSYSSRSCQQISFYKIKSIISLWRRSEFAVLIGDLGPFRMGSFLVHRRIPCWVRTEQTLMWHLFPFPFHWKGTKNVFPQNPGPMVVGVCRDGKPSL